MKREDTIAVDAIALEAAYRVARVARVLALATLPDASVQQDVPAVQEALADLVRQVGEVQGQGAPDLHLDRRRRGLLIAWTACVPGSCGRWTTSGPSCLLWQPRHPIPLRHRLDAPAEAQSA